MRTQVVIRRGGVVESRHRIDAAVVDGNGRRVGRVGDPDLVTFMRSSAKPIQALTVVPEGVASRFRIPPDELALCCASHSGEPRAAEVVLVRILEQLGLLEKPAVHALVDRRPLLVANRRGESAAVLEAEFTGEEDA